MGSLYDLTTLPLELQPLVDLTLYFELALKLKLNNNNSTPLTNHLFFLCLYWLVQCLTNIQSKEPPEEVGVKLTDPTQRRQRRRQRRSHRPNDPVIKNNNTNKKKIQSIAMIRPQHNTGTTGVTANSLTPNDK
jgi:hypothetical protein